MINFSLPLLFSNALQMMYAIADSAVLGRMLGVNAFASVGVSVSMQWFVLSLVLGTAQGFGVIFAQRFGAGDMPGLRRALTTAACLSAGLGIAVGGAGIIGGGAILRFLNTPRELLGDSIIYMGFVMGGLPVTFIYNVLGSSLFALGDSKTPLKAMIISSLVNIALDFALVIPFGIAGVAAATPLAQSVACIYGGLALRRTGVFKGGGAVWDAASARTLLRIGMPLGLRNMVIEVGGLVIQRYVNNYGVEFVAGVAAAKRMYGLLLICGGAIEAAVATFTAQNFGAGLTERVKRGVRDGLFMAMATALLIMAIVLPFGRAILSVLVDGEPARIASVLDTGVRQLNMLALLLPVLCVLFLYRSALQGVGNALISMLSGLLELLVRVGSLVILTPLLGEAGVMLAECVGWAPVALLLLISYYVVFRGIVKKQSLVDHNAIA